MDSIDEIQESLDDGEYYRALKVSVYSKRLDVDLAAERIGAAHPNLASKISNIAQIIVHPKNKDVYAIACELRDSVLQTIHQRYPRIEDSVPALKSVVWSWVQRLLNCDFEKLQVDIAALTAESLAAEGLEWVVEDVLNACLPVLSSASYEQGRGVVTVVFQLMECPRCQNTRKVICTGCGGTGRIRPSIAEPDIAILIEDQELLQSASYDDRGALCEICRGVGRVPCDCIDQYQFSIGANPKPGSIVCGRGLRTGKFQYAIMERKISSARPSNLLLPLYSFHGAQKRMLGGLAGIEDSTEEGISIREVRSYLSCASFVGIFLLITLGWLIGYWTGSWQIGLSVTLCAIAILLSIFKMPSNSKIRRYLLFSFFLLPLYGAGIGYLFDRVRVGAIVGAEVLLGLLAFYAIVWFINKKFFL